MRRYIFTAISILLLIVTFFMFGYDPTKWYGKFYNFLSIFTPFVLGGLGILSAIFGIKGDIRKVLIVLNAFLMILFLGVYLIRIFGFQKL
ncbi:hypothetical protein [Lysinibacillus pakistanensis]|uniref:Uncharacterized protein n=1 Tax=Lysinibacillus pakistanensis TaxID=759811 RepID=A0AAX3WTD9_9BACI|nr:hypothetical protein [Lysinibacillus pakistanensis]MDM5230517.1 hypothetical protein [Lysinibacillus pakistanensis]QGG53270.1 hypothetical protein GDS87_21310 [Lysinibacillus pakistanensis]WHY46099.1 hypothetical protein QNH22_23040 [Lysinibacillus pakistanensis]WHY51110.1 hypothetical protein QNH24_23000 [Lysinibacillus pakistanensis]